MPIFLPNLPKKIPVMNGNGTELCSTTPAKARLLIKKRKAKVICTHPFVIRLNYNKIITERDTKIISDS